MVIQRLGGLLGQAFFNEWNGLWINAPEQAKVFRKHLFIPALAGNIVYLLQDFK